MSDSMLLLSLISLFMSAFLLSMSTSMAASNRMHIKKSLKKLDIYGEVSTIQDELSEPFLNRVILPLAKVFTHVGRKLTPAGYLDAIRSRLVVAGLSKDFDADRFLSYKGFSLIGGSTLAVLFIVVAGQSAAQAVLGAIFAGGCFFLPDLWLSRKIAARQKAIRLALPDTLDLLTISVEAGLGFDAALHKVVNNTIGPLSEEFYRLLQEIQLGTARDEAFRNFGERTQVDELGSFILAMLQAEVFGISIGKVLRVQAKELRIKRRQRAEEMAQKAPVKILFPLITCIFPAVLVVIMGPAIIQIYESILKSF
ncbi:MAG: type II secretion system F family protein [Firmicutes bacterium]|nr:type II secretion system F family protein [Bacillota bacterium]